MYSEQYTLHSEQYMLYTDHCMMQEATLQMIVHSRALYTVTLDLCSV